MSDLILPTDDLPENKVVLAVVGGDRVPFSFLNQLAQIYAQGRFPLIAVEGVYVHRNRTAAARLALNYAGWDYLMFLDPDMIYPEDMMSRVKRWRDPVVGGLYFGKTFPDHGPTCRILEDVDECRWRAPTREETQLWLDRPGMYDVDGLATGCMAIRRDVLENWPDDYPTFDTILASDGNQLTTEDAYFCWRAKQQGIQPRLDSRVVCGHVGQITVDERMWAASLDLMPVS